MLVKLDKGAFLPTRGTAGSAGWDLYAREDVIIPVGAREFIDTGVHVKLPSLSCGLICNRSGLAKKRAVESVLGVIDSDYRGSIGVTLKNLGREPFIVHAGDRISQLVVLRLPMDRDDIIQVDELDETERGDNGFGSTGV